MSNHASGFNTFVTLLYLLAHILGIIIIYNAVLLLLGSYDDLGSALGAVVVIIIYIVFWIIVQAIALLLLPMTKLWRQTTGILILSTIAVGINFGVVGYMFIQSYLQGGTRLEEGLIVILPFCLHSMALIKGFINRDENQ